MTPVTVHQLAAYRRGDDPEVWTGADYEALGFPFLGGCEVCGATIAPYNAAPTRTGFWRCASGCVADAGFESVEEADTFLRGEEQPSLDEQEVDALNRTERAGGGDAHE